MTPANLTEYNLSDPYINEPAALLVRDSDRHKFSRWSDLIGQEDLVIGIPEAFFYAGGVKKNLPDSVVWELSTPRLFFKEQGEKIDAMIFGAAGASAWTLLYPEYSVVFPKPQIQPIAIAFPLAKEDAAFV